MADSANESLHPLVTRCSIPSRRSRNSSTLKWNESPSDTLLQCWELDRNTRIQWVLSMEVFLRDVADAAMGIAFASTLEHDESFTTMNLAINFFRPVWNDRLRAEARVINRGKNVGYVECEITSSDGKQVAKATSTCCVLRGERSKQR